MTRLIVIVSFLFLISVYTYLYIAKQQMTSFTTEDRKSVESSRIAHDRIIIAFSNLIDDCYRLAKECDNPDVSLHLKLVANTVSKIGNDYYDLLHRPE